MVNVDMLFFMCVCVEKVLVSKLLGGKMLGRCDKLYEIGAYFYLST